MFFYILLCLSQGKQVVFPAKTVWSFLMSVKALECSLVTEITCSNAAAERTWSRWQYLCGSICILVFMFSIVSGTPTCRCPKGFTGPNCNRQICQDYCLNGGNCSVNTGNQPTCSCPQQYQGDQCQYSKWQLSHVSALSLRSLTKGWGWIDNLCGLTVSSVVVVVVDAEHISKAHKN